MCHTIGIYRDEKFQDDDHESDSTPEEECIFERLWHLSGRETLLERDDTIDHISEKYRLKQEERREEEIREDEEEYCFLPLSEEEKDFFECLEHMSLSDYLIIYNLKGVKFWNVRKGAEYPDNLFREGYILYVTRSDSLHLYI